MDVVKHKDRMLHMYVCTCQSSNGTRRLQRSEAYEITQRLEEIFLDRGVPAELLMDNTREFRGHQLPDLIARRGSILPSELLRFRAVHEPRGNGVVERNHCTMAAR